MSTPYQNQVNLGNYLWWTPWAGCQKVSPACKNCYIKTYDFQVADLDGYPALDSAPAGTIVIVSLHTDFFWEAADPYRFHAWQVIRTHPQLLFVIITKRLEHGMRVLPADWGDGWENVIISATIDNQEYAKRRVSQLKTFPAKHKWLTCTPLTELLNIEETLKEAWIEHVECSGEIGDPQVIRETRYEWVKALSDQCKRQNVRFSFMKCGNKFITAAGEAVSDSAYCYQSQLADSFNLSNYVPLKYKIANHTYKSL